jgi:tetratricopeptide (TPR) repeat protein
MIAWSTAGFDNVVPAGAAVTLLQRAIAAAPRSATLHTQLGNVHLDRFDFGQAALAFEAARRHDPVCLDVLARLTRCWNRLGRHADVVEILAAEGESSNAEIHVQHGEAFAALDRVENAEREFRRALDCDPRHRHACLELCGILRRCGRFAELLTLCESLADKGVAHAQLLLDWGRALAYDGQRVKAECLLFDAAKMSRTTPSTPVGFESLAAFNGALAEELSSNAHAITEIPVDEQATRGAALILHLLDGKRPKLIRDLLGAIQACVEGRLADTPGAATDFDPWGAVRPTRLRLRPWGLIQKSGDYEAWHTHRGGWLSGVYYVRIPEAFSVEGDGAGCIEFGPPPSLTQAGIAIVAPLRVAPSEGLLLLAPSHYHHRTIPFVSAGRRISVAFDVIDLDI